MGRAARPPKGEELTCLMGRTSSTSRPPSLISVFLIIMVLQLTISAINCNSLNMSHASKKNQALKIHGITKLKTDIILLSDIRLSNKNLVSAADDLEKVFNTNLNMSYKFFHNSTKNKRGVGIFISNDLDFSVVENWDDPEENFLLLGVNISGENLLIGSCYGPNETNPRFVEKIVAILRWQNGSYPHTILGGD
jgi:exonuclease III